MTEWFAYLVVLVAAATPWLEVLLVVPAGIVAGLPPVPTAAVGFVGNSLTLVPLVLGGDRVRGWWRARRAAGDRDDRAGGRGGRARLTFERYGLPGLAVIGPLVTGVHVAAIVALAAGAERRRTVVWLTAGIAVWAAIAAVATVLGLEAFADPDRLPDLGL